MAFMNISGVKAPDPASEFSPWNRKQCRELLYMGWTNEEIVEYLGSGELDREAAQRMLEQELARMIAHTRRPKAELLAMHINFYREFLVGNDCTPAMPQVLTTRRVRWPRLAFPTVSRLQSVRLWCRVTYCGLSAPFP